MSGTSLVTPEVAKWIGRVGPPVTSEPILARDVERYAIAIGDLDPVYFSAEVARHEGYRAIPAPVGYLYWVAHPWTKPRPPEQLGDDGRPRESDPLTPPLSVERVVRGGDEYEFHERIFVGDRITLSRRVADIYEKQGKESQLVFVIEDCTYTNDRGDLVARQRITRIYR